jgi:NAD(P)-dependent dehydrogenase (short-subunit alcohol dehydrogenase family)
MGLYAVTGSAGGIGGAIRSRIEAEGHKVIGVDVRDAEVVADLASAAGRQSAVEEVTRSAGDALDGLVVAAGIGGSTGVPSSLVARINYFGAVALLDGLRPLLERGEQASAVAIASNSATAAPFDDPTLVELLLTGDEEGAAAHADDQNGEAVYAQAKLALARAVRRRVPEWGKTGVRINAVSPGPVLTPLTEQALEHPETGPMIREFPIPIGRWGEKSEIAAAVWFLLSQGSWCHGSILYVDGGTDALLRPDSF